MRPTTTTNQHKFKQKRRGGNGWNERIGAWDTI